jgi:peptidoglycan/LPS O-acetylase OafA/YrhL
VTAPTLPHRRGLDGLRAFAVLAVLLYHADVSWVPGGFLGVDVFFVISGYLITSLLLAEVVSTQRVSLRAFWKRRARRLLPAVGALLVGVTLLALVSAHDSVERLRGDVLAALTYSSNWWQIVRGETYFESFGRPPLLRHLWSLAVEEQLYIVLPLVITLLLRTGVLRFRRAVAMAVLGLAAASMVLLDALWVDADPSRAWYGTDSRAGGLLVGVGLAVLWPMATRPKWRGVGRTLIDGAAVVSVVGLVVVMTVVDAADGFLHPWGFALTSVMAGILVVAITSPTSRVHRYLGMRPLQWLGTRSYAIYLWHWPIFMLTRPRVDVSFGGWRVLTLRLLLTGIAAELSWRLVEHPIRSGSFGRGWRELRQGVRVRIAIAATSVVAVLSAALGAGLATTAVTTTPELLATAAQSPTTATTLLDIPSTTRATTTTVTTTTSTSIATPAPTAPPVTTTTVPPPPAPPFGAVLAVGDSVMLAAKDALINGSGGRIYVDAAIGRQVEGGLMVLQAYKDRGTFSQLSAIVVHLGTNGAMSDDLFNQLATIVTGVPRVVLLNVRVPKEWEQQSNAAINGGTTRFEFMRLADWYTESGAPGMLANDGVHPSPEGARVYSYITMRALEGAPPPPPTTTTTAAPPPESTTTAPPSEPATPAVPVP